MPEYAVGLMAKFPVIGSVKTRLASTSGLVRALTVYRALLANAVAVVTGLDPDTYRRTAFVTPGNYVKDFDAAYPGFDELFAQKGSSLGGRMLNAFAELLMNPATDRACLIGADIPDLDRAAIDRAIDLLEDHDLVLGPTDDGGYYLIALGQAHHELFTAIPWGTGDVLRQTKAVADRLGLRVATLHTLRDLDDIADLKHFTSYHSLVVEEPD
jgi:hypothetical protein